MAKILVVDDEIGIRELLREILNDEGHDVVLAENAAAADAAATLIANAVDLPGHPAIARAAAVALDPDSDLGTRPVTRHVGRLAQHEIATALAAGHARAEKFRRAGRIHAAVLMLRGQVMTAGLEPTMLAA